MGVRSALARVAARGAHVLLVEVPGHWALRARAEAALIHRGWRIAVSPADADVLAICGAPGPELTAAVETVWDQLPGPRCHIQLVDSAGLDAALDRAEEELRDDARHRDDAQSRPLRPSTDPAQPGDALTDELHEARGIQHAGMEESGMDHSRMDHSGMNHSRMDHSKMDHSGMDHGGMDMAPEGIPLARGAEDRDRLEMDELEVTLGPVLPHWPAGLVLRCFLHGDVLARVETKVLDAGSAPTHETKTRQAHAARLLDHAAATLALAGWRPAAAEAERLRDLLLDGAADALIQPRLARLRRRVVRSRMLRWSLRDLGRVTPERLATDGLPGRLAGDTHARLLAVLDAAAEASNGSGNHAPAEATSLDLLAETVSGLDVATARLVVASFAMEPVAAAHTPDPHGMHHG